MLGLDPLDAPWARRGPRRATCPAVVDALVAVVLEQRQAARARKDFADRGRRPRPAHRGRRRWIEDTAGWAPLESAGRPTADAAADDRTAG